MEWYRMALEAPLFGGDRLYNSLLALGLFMAGAAIVFKAGKMFGWLLIIAGLVWAYLTFQELLYI